MSWHTDNCRSTCSQPEIDWIINPPVGLECPSIFVVTDKPAFGNAVTVARYSQPDCIPVGIVWRSPPEPASPQAVWVPATLYVSDERTSYD